jgi:Fe-S-cluster containining protein
MADELTAAELVRTVRATLLALEELRGDLRALAARVVALGEQVAATTADPAAAEAAVDARAAAILPAIAIADANAPGRIQLGDDIDKYAEPPRDGPPCLELLPICGARCCGFEVTLSSQDLDEGVLRWELGRPYILRHGPDRRCVHLGATGCDAYAHRPAICRRYDCREDPRVWADYARRELAPASVADDDDRDRDRREVEDARRRGLVFESLRVRARPGS